ncbi:MAG: TrmB family transcriptional regulator, partial [Ignavibacteria bacterium]
MTILFKSVIIVVASTTTIKKMSIEKEKHLIQKIESIGYSTYEARVFLVLYKGYRMSAAEIAKFAKIPRTSVYDIMKIFVQKGICNEITTPSKLVYEVIDKKVLEDKVTIETEQEYKRKIVKIKECFTELSPVFKSEQPPEYKSDVELIKGYNRQREQKFLELINNSKKGILLMNRLRGNVSNELDDVTRKFFKRGGEFKSIYESSGNFKIKVNNKWENVTKEGLIKLCETFIGHGEQVKLIEEVPQLMAIFDEKIVYFSLHDESMTYRDSSDIIINNKRFASFITSLFNMYWDKADTIE